MACGYRTCTSGRIDRGENSPAWVRRRRSRCVAEITRKLVRTGRSAPTGNTSFWSRARSSLTCNGSGISATSSRNRVPSLACTNRPLRAPQAPVKAPSTCPNSSASASDGLSAAMLTATNAAVRRALWRWMARAASSLPVPLSPSMSTEASEWAARAIRLKTLLHGGRFAEHLLDPDRRPGSGREWHGAERPVDRRANVSQIKRFDHVLERTVFHSPHRRLQVSEGRDYQDRRGTDQRAEPLHGRQAVHAGQTYVEHEELRRGGPPPVPGPARRTRPPSPRAPSRQPRDRPQQIDCSSSTIRILDTRPSPLFRGSASRVSMLHEGTRGAG